MRLENTKLQIKAVTMESAVACEVIMFPYFSLTPMMLCCLQRSTLLYVHVVIGIL